MKLGIIADIHGNPFALSAVIDAIEPEADRFLFLGDLTGYYAFVEPCVDLLKACGAVGVRGNHDQVFLSAAKNGQPPPQAYTRQYGTAMARAVEETSSTTIAYLSALPQRRSLEVDGHHLLMVHGTPWAPLEGRVYPDFDRWDVFALYEADVILMGQTHYPLAVEHAGKLIVNPGSVGQPRDDSPLASCAILDTETLDVTHRRVDFPRETLLRDCRCHDPQLEYLSEKLL